MADTHTPTSTLRRAITLIGGIFLTLSAVTPASSMFIILPGAITQAGTGILYSMVIAGVIGVVMALVYSELASAFPNAGGEYVMVAKIIGLWPSYIILVLNAVVMLLISTVLALGAGDYFAAVLPSVPARFTALSVVAVATLFGVLNIRLNAFITGTFLAIELLCILYFGYTAGTHVVQPFSIFTHPVTVTGGALQQVSLITILFATATTVFAFNGYEQAVYLTEEIKNVRNRIAWVIILSLFLGLALESIPTMLLLLASSNLPATLNSSAPFRDLTKVLAGETALRYMSAGISIAVLNACIVNMLMAARFLYSTGRDGFWGAFIGRHLKSIGRRQATPWIATLAVGIICAAACFVPFNFLLVLTGTGLVFVYFILCVSILVGRVNKTTAHTKFRMPFARLLPIIGMLALAGVGYANWQDPTIGKPSLEIAFGEILLASIIYALARRRIEIVDPHE
jgi:amino acid transporter